MEEPGAAGLSAAHALIASTYLAGTNTRRVRRALAALFGGTVAQGKERLECLEHPLSAEAWRTVLDDLIKRGLRRPDFLIVDGAPRLDKAIASALADPPIIDVATSVAWRDRVDHIGLHGRQPNHAEMRSDGDTHVLQGVGTRRGLPAIGR